VNCKRLQKQFPSLLFLRITFPTLFFAVNFNAKKGLGKKELHVFEVANNFFFSKQNYKFEQCEQKNTFNLKNSNNKAKITQ
jgi:hypothetical protein